MGILSINSQLKIKTFEILCNAKYELIINYLDIVCE